MRINMWPVSTVSVASIALMTLLSVSVATMTARAQTSDESAIRALRATSNRAIAAHDVAGAMAFMVPEYVAVSSSNVRTVGREATRANYASVFAARPDAVFIRTPRSISVNAQWHHAAESGDLEASWSGPDGKTRIGGVYFAKWVQRDGAWKVLSETFVQLTCAGGAFCETPPAAPKDSTR